MTVSYEGKDYWLHDLSPFIIQFSENSGIRWYGFAYVLGFVTAAWLLSIYFKKQKSPTNKIASLPDSSQKFAKFSVVRPTSSAK